MKVLFYLSLLCLLLNVSCKSKNKTNVEDSKKAIETVLNQQIIDWNAGNIDAYMQGYWQSDELIFVGKGGIQKGWKNTLNMYKKGYSDTAAMGKLSFEIYTIDVIDTTATVLGKWLLNRTIGDINGYFTLVLKNKNGNWKIIQDHSS